MAASGFLWAVAGYVLGVLTMVAVTLWLVRHASKSGRHRYPPKVLHPQRDRSEVAG